MLKKYHSLIRRFVIIMLLFAFILCQCGIGFASKEQVSSLYMKADQGAGAMFRWWVPAATSLYKDPGLVEHEIQTIYETGYAGVEVSVLTAEGDLENYGWGTKGWIEFLKIVYSLAKKYGLTVDVTVTCGWPKSLPAKYAFEGYSALEQNLFNGESATFNSNGQLTIMRSDGTNRNLELDTDLILYSDKGEAYNKDIHDDPRENRILQCVSVARLLGTTEIDKGKQKLVWGCNDGSDNSFQLPGMDVNPAAEDVNIPEEPEKMEVAMPPLPFFDNKEPNKTPMLVDIESLQVLKKNEDYELDPDKGEVIVKWRPNDEGEYRVFTYWSGFSGAVSEKGSVEKNYYIDYMTPEGVKAYIDFWEQNILYDEELRKLIKDVGMSLFEDSIEFGSYFGTDYLEWGYSFLDEFKNYIGYDLAPYLPLLEGQTMGGTSNVEYYNYEIAKYDVNTKQYIYSDEADRIRNDLSRLYTILFADHVSQIQKWGEKYNITYRMQACSFNYDAAYLSAIVDYPDVETLGFFEITKDGGKYEHGYDKSRLVAAGAHLGNHSVVSSECGALPNLTYRMTWAKIMEYIQLQYALGANRMIFHGYSHAVGDLNDQWPGYEGFGMLADSWGERNPGWRYERSVAEYMSRTQDILRNGSAVADVAIYNDHYGTYSPIWNDLTLRQAGYSYEFVSENLLGLDTAYVSNGVLAPENGGYRALIFKAPQYISVAMAEKIKEFLDNGLRIVVVGDFPSKTSSYKNWKEEEARLAKLIPAIISHKNTLTAEDEADVVSVLQNNGIMADATLIQPANIFSAHRRINGTDYYYMYNDSKIDVSQEIKLHGSGNLYLIDLWSGKITQLADFMVQDDGIQRTFEFEGNESIMVAVTSGELYKVSGDMPATINSMHTAIASGASTQVNNHLIQLKVKRNDTFNVRMGNDVEKNIEISDLPPILDLFEGWTLKVERWEKAEKSQKAYETKRTIINVGSLAELLPWQQIMELGADVSGIGYYKNSFTLPKLWSNADGAILDLNILDDKQFGCTLVRVLVNGIEVPINQIQFKADIGNLLHAGENTIEIETASTLANQLVAYGRFNYETTNYGLYGVKLIPYKYVEIDAF